MTRTALSYHYNTYYILLFGCHRSSVCRVAAITAVVVNIVQEKDGALYTSVRRRRRRAEGFRSFEIFVSSYISRSRFIRPSDCVYLLRRRDSSHRTACRRGPLGGPRDGEPISTRMFSRKGRIKINKYKIK